MKEFKSKGDWHHFLLIKMETSSGVYFDGILIQLNSKKVWKGIIQLEFRNLAYKTKNKFLLWLYHKIYGHMYS